MLHWYAPWQSIQDLRVTLFSKQPNSYCRAPVFIFWTIHQSFLFPFCTPHKYIKTTLKTYFKNIHNHLACVLVGTALCTKPPQDWLLQFKNKQTNKKQQQKSLSLMAPGKIAPGCTLPLPEIIQANEGRWREWGIYRAGCCRGEIAPVGSIKFPKHPETMQVCCSEQVAKCTPPLLFLAVLAAVLDARCKSRCSHFAPLQCSYYWSRGCGQKGAGGLLGAGPHPQQLQGFLANLPCFHSWK